MQHIADSNPAVLPSELHGFPQELTPEIQAHGRSQQDASLPCLGSSQLPFPFPIPTCCPGLKLGHARLHSQGSPELMVQESGRV